MNDEIVQTYHFSLYNKHIELLDTINDNNRSLALRTLLDSVINGEQQTKRKKILDNSIMWACFGAMFLFISYLLTPTIQVICIMIGIFLFAYGTIGGTIHALQTAKRYR